MDRIRIVGGRRLAGTIPISGAKNAALPLMIASLLTDQTLILDNVPRLADVNLLQRILGNHGVDVMIGGKRRAETQYEQSDDQSSEGHSDLLKGRQRRRRYRMRPGGVAPNRFDACSRKKDGGRSRIWPGPAPAIAAAAPPGLRA